MYMSVYGHAHKETLLLCRSAPKHQNFAFKPPKRAAVCTGSPHLSPLLHRLVFSVQLHVPLHLFSLRSLAQPFSNTTLLAVVVLMQYWQRLAGKWDGTPKHGKFPNSPFFIAGDLAQHLLSCCWLTRLATPRGHSSVARCCLYMCLEEVLSFMLHKLTEGRGKISFPSPPSLYFHRLCSQTDWEYSVGIYSL